MKNIPTPVHAYMVAMRREDGSYSTPQMKKPAASKSSATANWMWPLVVAVISLVAIGVAGFLYFTKIELLAPPKETSTASNATTPRPSPPATPAPMPTMATPPPPSPIPSGEKFAADTVPFVSDRSRVIFTNDYVPAADYKALALNTNGVNVFVSGQQNEEAAKNAALDQCEKRADAVQPVRRCELYAVGNSVIYPHGRPPMPPLPWIRHDPSTERPFAARDVPIVRDPGKARIETVYPSARKSKTIAIGPAGKSVV